GTTAFGFLRLNGTGTVTGTVLDPDGHPVSATQVKLQANAFSSNSCSLSYQAAQSTLTDANGKFRFAGVNVGQVSVAATPVFYPPAGAASTLASSGQTVDLTIQLSNTTAGVLSGTVYLPDKTPAGAGVQVTANGELPNVTVTTDAQSHFAFAKIFPQGSYTITAQDPITGDQLQDNIFLKSGQNMVHDMKLKGTGTVLVTVVDGSNQPISSATVTLTETAFPNNSYDAVLQPGSQGVVEFDNVFQGPISVKASD